MTVVERETPASRILSLNGESCQEPAPPLPTLLLTPPTTVPVAFISTFYEISFFSPFTTSAFRFRRGQPQNTNALRANAAKKCKLDAKSSFDNAPPPPTPPSRKIEEDKYRGVLNKHRTDTKRARQLFNSRRSFRI